MWQVTYRPIFMVTPDDEYTQEQRSAYLEFVSCLGVWRFFFHQQFCSLQMHRKKVPTITTENVNPQEVVAKAGGHMVNLQQIQSFKGKSWVPMGEYPRYIPTYTTYMGYISI